MTIVVKGEEGETVTTTTPKVTDAPATTTTTTSKPVEVVQDGDIQFTFADKNGNSEISATAGEEITLYANVKAGGKAGSASVAAKDGKTVVTLEFKVDEKCAEGKYDIKWAEEVISSALSKNITSNVEFVDGSITVKSTPDADAVSWVIPDVTVEAGAKSAELKIQVKGNSDLAVAGAQFAFAVKSPITLKSVSGKP